MWTKLKSSLLPLTTMLLLLLESFNSLWSKYFSKYCFIDSYCACFFHAKSVSCSFLNRDYCKSISTILCKPSTNMQPQGCWPGSAQWVTLVHSSPATQVSVEFKILVLLYWLWFLFHVFHCDDLVLGTGELMNSLPEIHDTHKVCKYVAKWID